MDYSRMLLKAKKDNEVMEEIQTRRSVRHIVWNNFKDPHGFGIIDLCAAYKHINANRSPLHILQACRYLAKVETYGLIKSEEAAACACAAAELFADSVRAPV